MAPDDPLAERVAARLRAPVPLSDRIERTVLERLRGEANEGAAARPLHQHGVAIAAALAACFILVFGLGILVGRRSVAPSATDSNLRSVEFALRAPADSAIALVGDFNDWNPRATPLNPGSDGLWSVTVPLRPGRYRYTFIVDGTRWLQDPTAPRALEDDFGAPTSVITIARR